MNGVVISLAILFGAPLVSSGTAAAQEIRGPAFAHDGDDIVVGGTRVRLHGIDAFELGQTCTIDGAIWSCGHDARSVLDEIVANAEVRCVVAQTALSQGRPVVRCYVDRVEVNGELVRRGFTFDCTRFSKGRYRTQEASARASKAGAWRGQFAWPWTSKGKDYCGRGHTAFDPYTPGAPIGLRSRLSWFSS